jgi:3-oxoacyl-[acyl-carrier protein] reductase
MADSTSGKTLAGKLALVTGASRGIGAAIAKRLAADGAAVLVHYANSPAKADAVVADIRKAGGLAEAVGADLADRNGPATLARHIDAAFGGKFGGRLDVLVNNAGVGAFGPPVEMSDEELTKVIQVNFRAVFELARDAARRMTKAKSGRIINVGSCLGERIFGPDMTIYSATKFAVVGLTKGLSRDLGPHGITVNNVQPGPTDTDMNPVAGEGADMQRGQTSVGHYGKPDDIANAVAFLASPAAAFINGESLTVDGGVNA